MTQNIVDLTDLSDDESIINSSQGRRRLNLESWSPFFLNKLRNGSETHDRYTISIADILSGSFSMVLLANFMLDLEWLFTECPRLLVNIHRLFSINFIYYTRSFRCSLTALKQATDIPLCLLHGEGIRRQAEMTNYLNLIEVNKLAFNSFN